MGTIAAPDELAKLLVKLGLPAEDRTKLHRLAEQGEAAIRVRNYELVEAGTVIQGESLTSLSDLVTKRLSKLSDGILRARLEKNVPPADFDRYYDMIITTLEGLGELWWAMLTRHLRIRDHEGRIWFNDTLLGSHPGRDVSSLSEEWHPSARTVTYILAAGPKLKTKVARRYAKLTDVQRRSAIRRATLDPLLEEREWTIADWARAARQYSKSLDYHTAADYLSGKTARLRKDSRHALAAALDLADEQLPL